MTLFGNSKPTTAYSGRVERLGALHEISGRIPYALLLAGQHDILILDTRPVVGADDFGYVLEIRKRIALTVPNDEISFQMEGHYVVAFENENLAERLAQRQTA